MAKVAIELCKNNLRGLKASNQLSSWAQPKRWGTQYRRLRFLHLYVALSVQTTSIVDCSNTYPQLSLFACLWAKHPQYS
jgi:hypothetical protein